MNKNQFASKCIGRRVLQDLQVHQVCIKQNCLIIFENGKLLFYLCIFDVRAYKALLERQDLTDLPEQLGQLVQPDLLGFVFILFIFHFSF
jgi:hypothetical protein